MKTQDYLKLVVTEVASQGAPTGDFVTTMTERAQAAIRKVVPANYRLAVRIAVRGYAKQFTKLAKAI